MKNLIYLKSVGSYLNQQKGIIYPTLKNNQPDTNCPMSLKYDEISKEWFDSLSSYDMHLVNCVDTNRLFI